MRIPKGKAEVIKKAYEAGEIKEISPYTFSVPHRFFLLGITPGMVVEVIKRIKAK